MWPFWNGRDQAEAVRIQVDYDFVHDNSAVKSGVSRVGFIFFGRNIYLVLDVYCNSEIVETKAAVRRYGRHPLNIKKCSCPHNRGWWR